MRAELRPGPEVILLDFGMVGEISESVREQLRRIFLAVIRRDYDQILAALDVPAEWLPEVYESPEITGQLMPAVAAELGLVPDTPVAAGATGKTSPAASL